MKWRITGKWMATDILVEAESFDEALAKVRELNENYDGGQVYTEQPEDIATPEKRFIIRDGRTGIPISAQLYMTIADAVARQDTEVKECHRLGIPATAADFEIYDAIKNRIVA